MSKKALIVWGGWDGHDPDKVAKRFSSMLVESGYEVEISDSLESFSNHETLMGLDVIATCVTMSEIKPEYVQNISKAVAAGTGLVGCHGGMCDAFRNDTQWQFMTGGQWVSHPGGDGVEYTVHIHHSSSPIIQGLDDFEVKSEHYYLHIDPAIEVIASTRMPLVPYYHMSNKPIDMPVAWTKYWGNGRVFYCSLGHQDNVFDNSPNAHKLMQNGILWAGEGKAYAVKNGLTTERFENDMKMY